SRPGRPKKPGELGARPVVGCDGCVTERWIGEPGDGAVRVGAGVEKVREPRLPMLDPPPARASASLTRAPQTSATAAKAASARTKDRIMKPSQVPIGSADGRFIPALYRIYGAAFEVPAQASGKPRLFRLFPAPRSLSRAAHRQIRQSSPGTASGRLRSSSS